MKRRRVDGEAGPIVTAEPAHHDGASESDGGVPPAPSSARTGERESPVNANGEEEALGARTANIP